MHKCRLAVIRPVVACSRAPAPFAGRHDARARRRTSPPAHRLRACHRRRSALRHGRRRLGARGRPRPEGREIRFRPRRHSGLRLRHAGRTGHRRRAGGRGAFQGSQHFVVSAAGLGGSSFVAVPDLASGITSDPASIAAAFAAFRGRTAGAPRSRHCRPAACRRWRSPSG